MEKCKVFTCTILVYVLASLTVKAEMSKCYVAGSAQRCRPSFVNAAYGRPVVASNTCGTPAEEYCLQTGRQGVTKSCHICDSSRPSLSHDAKFLTDLSQDNEERSWWQSNSMLHDVQYPNMVNLTLNLNKTFDITYVRLMFHSPRPESFAIYKKKCNDCPWQPWQYYSGTCFSTYGIDNDEIVPIYNEQKALCTDEFSDISPLTGGNIAFSTLQGRPSAYEFDRSLVLQDWVKAVAIRISLNRLNTFGDEVFKDPEVLKSYFYAISDLSVGGTCSCNGHANECYLTATEVIVCRCQHNTAGADCERCADGYNDLKWKPATREDPSVCQKCDCNGKSEKCEYDHSLFLATGRGGRCIDCSDNTDGPNCQDCLPYHYRDARTNQCEACNCNQLGSRTQRCDGNGQCMCKPGVGGSRCDQCLEGYYGLNEGGCSLCRCYDAGTVQGTICDSESGQCSCKLNVEGLRCNKCKLGSMNLQSSNPYGCISCFCYGHSSVCRVSNDYTKDEIISDFYSDRDSWIGTDFSGADLPVYHRRGAISMKPDQYLMTYFVAPDKFLGDQQKSYGQFLSFDLKLDEYDSSSVEGSGYTNVEQNVRTSRSDLVLEGNGNRISLTITEQGNPLPKLKKQNFRFRLHEAAGFEPKLSSFEFQKLLNRLTAIKIRSSYAFGSKVYLDNVKLETAVFQGSGEPADWVEVCEKKGYIPGSLNTCKDGYTRDPPNGNEFDNCVPCNCHGHGDTCNPNTGVCVCMHNTIGDHCELCAEGFYFNKDERRRGTPQECQPCPCPDNSGCALIEDTNEVVCVNCPVGYAGKQCELCTDGWFGDPRGRGPCQQCMCNGNVDDNAVMNCNTTTGECLKCIYNTTGFYCDQCLPGYFGKPISSNPNDRCQLCECDGLGSRHLTDCDSTTGNCDCFPFVTGQKCDRCQKGYWNLNSGGGCEACMCHSIGSVTGECDEDTGDCVCLPGVGGTKCNQCLPNHYGMTREGCKACDCNPDGSASLQCGENGKCMCHEGVLGLKCDMCQENYHNIKAGCIECPACYGLVQDAVDNNRAELEKLENIVENFDDQPPTDARGDADFESKLNELNNTVAYLFEAALQLNKDEDDLREEIGHVSTELQKIFAMLTNSEDDIDSCARSVEEAGKKSEDTKDRRDRIQNSLDRADRKLIQAAEDLVEAKRIADETENRHDNMTKLANEAERLSNNIQSKSAEASNTAQEALDASTKARDSIQEALDVLNELMQNLEDVVEEDLPAVGILRDELLDQSGKMKTKADTVKKQSTDLFTAASKLDLPAIDTDLIISQAKSFLLVIERMTPTIDNLFDEYNVNYFELTALVAQADSMYSTMQANQQSVDQLLARADAVYQNANESVTRGNTIYESLLHRLRTLQGFDEEIKQNQIDANASLEKADEIRQKITEANEITNETHKKLGESRKLAKQASDKAEQSLDIASSIQAESEKIKEEATTGQATADSVSMDANALLNKLDALDEGLTLIEEKVDGDDKQLQETITQMQVAKSNASTAHETVDRIVNKLNQLIIDLDGLETADDSKLEELEGNLELLRVQVDSTNLAEEIKKLEEASLEQEKEIESYDLEIAQLRKDIKNLEDIRDTIPKECAASQQVEQP